MTQEAQTEKAPHPARTLLTAYYDDFAKSYLLPDRSGGWVSVNETSVKRKLKSLGYDPKAEGNQLVSEVDIFMIDTQEARNVNYSGPVAGYFPGVHSNSHGRFLVTKGPEIIQPNPSVSWDVLGGMITRMLGEEQLEYVYGWLHFARASLISGLHTPGQALCIAGKKDCGKSLFQNLITLMLGGRSARPYQFMSGQTQFNAHLFAAEHLMIEDESPNSDMRSRRMMGAMIKSFTVNDEQSCHRKGSTPFMLRPFWRVSITVNDDPEYLMVLPPIDDSIEDKLILLKAEKHDMPMPTFTAQDRAAFGAVLKAELPGFMAFVDAWSIPEELKSQRFGIKHFHNHELLSQLDSLAPEEKLLSIIDQYIVFSGLPWTGKSADLERRITDHDCPYSREAQKLFSWASACGTYLGRLHKRYPNRFKREQKGEERDRTWTILPKAEAVEEATARFRDEEEWK